MYTKAFIPYKGYYSTPFCRWQGSMANENAIVLGANTAKRWFAEKGFDVTMLDYMYFGITIGQPGLFYSHNWTCRPSWLIRPAPHLPHACIYLPPTWKLDCIRPCST
jgi:hypothetical protein